MTLRTRIENLEQRLDVHDDRPHALVIQMPHLDGYHFEGMPISEEDLSRLKETHDVILMTIVNVPSDHKIM